MGTVANLLRAQANPFPYLSAIGWMYNASAAAASTTVTGSTSFANTDPTFLLDVPSGTTCIPSYMSLGQTGTVAFAAISLIMEVDDA